MPTELVAQSHCELAENPLWNEREQALYWTDIPAGKLYRYFADRGDYECFYSGPVVGGFTFQEDNSLLLFEADRIAKLLPDGSRHVLLENIDADMRRFNDVITDPEGRVFAGTIGKTREIGGLYRVDLDGSVTELFKGTGCSNGLAFSPDLGQLYWTCTTTRTLFRFDYDRASGDLSNRTALYISPAEEGTPDGLTIDTEGNLWTSRWGGHAVLKLSSSGSLIGKAALPVSAVTSAVFGGPDLSDLYVTTAGGSAGGTSDDGAVFRVSGVGRGAPEFRSRVFL